VTLRDTVQIKSPPEKVWTFIEDPERMKAWNPKIQTVAPISWGERDRGYRYRITYAMGKKTSEFFAEIIEYRKPETLVIRHTEGNLPIGSSINETYRLSPTDDGTSLEQRIEINNSGVNLFWRLLIGFVYRFGKPTGQKYLEKLKELAETSSQG
jgi:uncharacterized protein YndB with AHSA1/START domain